MTRYAARSDANQPHVFSVARSLGLKVWPTHRVGGGFPDCVVAYGKVVELWELKSDTSITHRRKGQLTPDEQAFRDLGFPVRIIETDDDVIQAAREIRAR